MKANVNESIVFMASQLYEQDVLNIVDGTHWVSKNLPPIVFISSIPILALSKIPYCGTMTIAYIPTKKIIHQRQMLRIIEHFSRSIQCQDNLTNLISKGIMDRVKPRGIAIQLKCTDITGEQNTIELFMGCFNNSQLQHEFGKICFTESAKQVR